jgi:hypothetical protein
MLKFRTYFTVVGFSDIAKTVADKAPYGTYTVVYKEGAYHVGQYHYDTCVYCKAELTPHFVRRHSPYGCGFCCGGTCEKGEH